jgi:hypothetical protein
MQTGVSVHSALRLAWHSLLHRLLYYALNVVQHVEPHPVLSEPSPSNLQTCAELHRLGRQTPLLYWVRFYSVQLYPVPYPGKKSMAQCLAQQARQTVYLSAVPSAELALRHRPQVQG